MGSRESEEETFDVFKRQYSLPDTFVHHPGNTAGDEGKPDFIGVFDGKTLGIEITEINIPDKTYGEPLPKDELTGRPVFNPAYRMYGQPLRKHEVAKRKIVDGAHEKAIQSGLPPLRVAVYFAGNLPKGTAGPLTTALFEIVRSHCPEPGNSVKLSEEDGLPKEFWELEIQRYADPLDWWDYIEAGGVETEFSDQMQEIIDIKSGKISQYLRFCDACWLIIVALGDRPSSFYQPGNHMRMTRYTSAFSRVFFLNGALRMINELDVEKPQGYDQPESDV